MMNACESNPSKSVLRSGMDVGLRRRRLPLVLGLLAACGLLAVMVVPARAAGPVPSLSIVPADAAFYSAMLRNQEQLDAIVNSKAYAKIKALPYVQMGLTLLQMQAADPESPIGRFEAARHDPEVKRTLNFLGELFADEVFIYGGPSFNQAVELFQGTFGEYNSANFMAGFNQGFQRARGGTAPAVTPEVQARAFVQALIKRMDQIKFPELVIGFKVKDKALAKEQAARIETNLRKLADQAPPLQGRIKQTIVDGRSFITINLDGSMVPWDQEIADKIHSMAATPDEGDKLIEHLKKVTLVISLGLRDDYFVLAIGPSTDVLTHLGKGPSLGSLPELAAVKKFADKRICSVSYASKTLNEHFGQTKAGIDNLLKTGKTALAALPVPDALREEIAKDATDIASDIKVFIPEPGAESSIGFLTDSGLESYNYDWTEHPELDSSKPLDLLKHIGGNPIAAVVGRSKVSLEGYDLLIKWIGVGYRYVEKYALPQMKPKERAEFDKVFAQVKPLLARLDKTTRQELIPALDGQTALVIDAKLTSSQFLKALPPTDVALPMFEPALVFGVSDAAALKRAFTEYYSVADDFVEVLKGVDKSEVPKDFKIPRPRVFRLKLGTAYAYALPAEWGVDTKVLPNAGLSDKVAVLSISGKHTLRLLGDTEPKIAGLTLPTDRPLATVGGLDFAAFIDALTPWVDLALDKAKSTMAPSVAQMASDHSKAVLEVLKVYRGTVAETYAEGKVTVTHIRSEFHDIAD